MPIDDVFAPPTHDELADTHLLAGPSAEELHGVGAGPQPGYLESALRGVSRGLTLGASDRIAGAGSALASAVQKGSLSDLVKDYISGRDAYRADTDSVQAAHPRVLAGSELAGGLATAAIPGLNIGAAETLGGRAAGAAGLGAAAGLANTKDLTNLRDAAKNAGVGAATGAVLQPVFEKAVAPALGWVGGKVGDAAGALGKKILNTGFDVPEAVTERYLNNPDAVNNALDKEGVAQKLADTLAHVKSDVGPATQDAVGHLSTERLPVPELEMTKAVQTLRQFDDPAAQKLAEKLEEQYAARSSGVSREANPGYLTEREMHDVKKTLQGLTDWKNPLPSADQAVARQAAGEANQTLRNMNGGYAAGMDEASQIIGSKNALGQKFGIEQDYSGANESGYKFTDRTISALKDLVNGNKVDRERILNTLRDQGYGDLAEQVQNTLAKEKLNGFGNPNGSRKAVMGYAGGSALGTAVGSWVGAPLMGHALGGAIGGAAGGALDKYGPQIAKKALDATVLTKQLSSSPGASKFIGAIKSAASRGQGALAATHFLLSQQSPEYQAATTQGD